MAKPFLYDLYDWISLKTLRHIINIWPPLLGAGIKIEMISDDFRRIKVALKLKWSNKNYVGTHYGGSIYSMTDPFYMLMLIKNLGDNYIVWDKAAYIDFKKPGRNTLHASFVFSAEELEDIRKKADENEKYVFDKHVDVFDEQGDVVASIVKTLYVRRKRP
jgi:acyl-coenzyme A thioesterase PaaI-like protein